MNVLEKVDHGYVILDNVFDNFEEMKAHIRALNYAGGFVHDKTEVPGRLSIHNEPKFKREHENLGDKLKKMLNIQMKPSYCFLMQYLPGSHMYKHTDREQCRFNFGVHIEGSEIFHIKIGNSTHKIDLKPNQGILYSGAIHEHWLNPCKNYRSAVIYHFVDEEFDGGLE